MSGYGDFVQRLAKILKSEGRYREEAYLFVMTALGRAIENLEKPRHVTGCELLQFIRKEAEDQFGPMAATVFGHWGIKNSLDFGRIVFKMVDEGILSKTETDTLEDFNDAVFFQTLFDHASGYRLADDESPLKRPTQTAKNGVKKNG